MQPGGQKKLACQRLIGGEDVLTGKAGMNAAPPQNLVYSTVRHTKKKQKNAKRKRKFFYVLSGRRFGATRGYRARTKNYF